jgi:hypothetical protein
LPVRNGSLNPGAFTAILPLLTPAWWDRSALPQADHRVRIASFAGDRALCQFCLFHLSLELFRDVGQPLPFETPAFSKAAPSMLRRESKLIFLKKLLSENWRLGMGNDEAALSQDLSSLRC